MPRRAFWVSPAYAAGVAATAAVLHGLLTGPSREAVVDAASTSPHNLDRGRWTVLVTSAFVTEEPPLAVVLLALLVLTGAAEVVHGPAGLLVVVAAGHIGGSLLVYLGLRAAVARGWSSPRRLREPDVGISYAVLAAAGSLLPVLPARRAATAGLGLLLLGPVLRRGTTPTDVGHLLAGGLGLAAGAALRRRR